MNIIKRLIIVLEQQALNTYNGYERDKPILMLKSYVRNFVMLNRAITNRQQKIYRGEIYWCDLGENIGCEECKCRPAVIIQNQKGNDNSPTTIIAPITNATITLPVAIKINREIGSPITGTIDLGQIRVVSKGRLYRKIDKLTTSEQKAVDKALMLSVGLYKYVVDKQNDSHKIVELTRELNDYKQIVKELSEK